MNSKAAVCVVMALSMSTGSVAFAQGNRDHDERGDGGDRGRGAQMHRGGDNDHNRQTRPQYQHDEHGFGRHHDEEMRGGRGAGPNHAYYRGDRLPAQYRDRYYVVDDWRGHQLSAPPRGYHWVQSGGDYLLVAVATGVILQLLLGR